MMQVLKIRLVYTSRLAYFSCYYLGFVFSAVVMRVEVLWSVPSWWEEPIYLQCRLVRTETHLTPASMLTALGPHQLDRW